LATFGLEKFNDRHDGGAVRDNNAGEMKGRETEAEDVGAGSRSLFFSL